MNNKNTLYTALSLTLALTVFSGCASRAVGEKSNPSVGGATGGQTPGIVTGPGWTPAPTGATGATGVTGSTGGSAEPIIDVPADPNAHTITFEYSLYVGKRSDPYQSKVLSWCASCTGTKHLTNIDGNTVDVTLTSDHRVIIHSKLLKSHLTTSHEAGLPIYHHHTNNYGPKDKCLTVKSKGDGHMPAAVTTTPPSVNPGGVQPVPGTGTGTPPSVNNPGGTQPIPGTETGTGVKGSVGTTGSTGGEIPGVDLGGGTTDSTTVKGGATGSTTSGTDQPGGKQPTPGTPVKGASLNHSISRSIASDRVAYTAPIGFQCSVNSHNRSGHDSTFSFMYNANGSSSNPVRVDSRTNVVAYVTDKNMLMIRATIKPAANRNAQKTVVAGGAVISELSLNHKDATLKGDFSVVCIPSWK